MPTAKRVTNSTPFLPHQNNGQQINSTNQVDDLFADVRPVQQRPESIMFSLYGLVKSGKTRLAGTFPKPLLILGSEDGTASLIGAKGIDFKAIKRCDDVPKFADRLRTEVKCGWKENKGKLEQVPFGTGDTYKTIVFDNASSFRSMMVEEKLGIVRDWKSVSTDSLWQDISVTMKTLLRPILQLGRDRLYNLVVISQEAELNDRFSKEKNKSSSYDDLIRPIIGPAVGKSVADWINAECDYIGQTHIRQKYEEKEVPGAIEGSEPIIIRNKLNDIEYCLRLKPNEVYQAGFRVSLGVKIEEEFMVDPTYEKIVKLIIGEDYHD